ncbi:hypothetical protein CLOBE_27240 [Clostridium beijerinckii]|nr:hypothetical protein CLOBE_27240 [Clostridium beijerinckii]
MNIKRYSRKIIGIRIILRGGDNMENTRRLDFSKLNFSEKVVTTKEALRDVLPFNLDKDTNMIVTGINKK